MTEKTTPETITPVQKKLLETLRRMQAKGIKTDYKTLTEAMPGHSSRDYSAAMRLYLRECEVANKWADSKPAEVSAYGEILASMSWSWAKEQFSKVFEEELRRHRSEVDMLCAEREKCETEKLALQSRLEELQEDLAQKDEALNQAVRENEKLRSDLAERDASISRLRATIEIQNSQINHLNELWKRMENLKLVPKADAAQDENREEETDKN